MRAARHGAPAGGHALGRGVRRSVALFRSFLVEQSDPDRFYTLLAQDSVNLLHELGPPAGRRVLDVGAGPPQFGVAFRQAGASYLPLDRDPAAGAVQETGVVATAEGLPFRSGSVDVVFSSNLLEHVREPERVADELLRVVKPGGLLILSYTNWLSPWGGHETSPYHWLGGRRAAARYARRHGHPPKNLVDSTLFRVSVRQLLRWVDARRDVAEVLRLQPRYLPPVARFVVHVPLVRELLTWNLLIVLRKR